MSSPRNSVPIPLPPTPHHSSSSESVSAVRISSPLNPLTSSPSSTPTGASSPLPPPDPPRVRYRGHTSSTLRNPSPPTPGRVTPPTQSPTPSTLQLQVDSLLSRSRSRSPRRPVNGNGSEGGAPSSSHWWGTHESRPWRKNTVPAEQRQGWEHTGQRVARAAVCVLGVTGDITHELLQMSPDLLDFVPIPGLSTAAKTLLSIWDTLQMVDTNRLACLRLTERCAEILLSVRQEVKDNGDAVGRELEMPIGTLATSFSQVHEFLQDEVDRPFYRRYLKRDEILADVARCDQALGDALGLFNRSIQIRILKQVLLAEQRRQADTQALISLMRQRNENADTSTATNASLLLGPGPSAPQSIANAGSILLGTEPPGIPSPQSVPVASTPPSFPSPANPLPSLPQGSPIIPPLTPTSQFKILNTLQTLHTQQNEQDAAHDMADLRQLMRSALETKNDEEMIGVLQVGREEMPEAVDALQRALERVVEKESASPASAGSDVLMSSQEGPGKPSRRTSVAPPAPLEMQAGELVLEDLPEDDVLQGSFTRSRTFASVESVASGISEEDALDRVFIESGIGALKRMSKVNLRGS